MISGHLQGQVLQLFSNLIKPKNALEIGTYTGYSAICIARGLKKNESTKKIRIRHPPAPGSDRTAVKNGP